MTGPAETSERYVLEERLESTLRGERAIASDARLKRQVLLWTAGGAPTDPRREALLSLGKQAARLNNSVFLPVLDAVVEPERVAVVLQAPACAPLTPGQAQTLEEIGGAKRVVLEVARALDAAGRQGLMAHWLPLIYLYVGPEGIRLDPIGVLALPGEEAADQVGLLLGLAEEIGADDADLTGLIGRWRERATARPSLAGLVQELEAITPEAAGYPLPHGTEDDVTMPLPAQPDR